MGSRDGFGMLVWTLPVRLVDVSRAGCRVEVDRHLAAGTNGQLELEMDGVHHLDDIRVCRCQRREGAGRVYHLGVELLRTRRLSPRSLRLAMRRLIGEAREPFADGTQAAPVPAAADEREEQQKQEDGRAPPAPLTVHSQATSSTRRGAPTTRTRTAISGSEGETV